MKTQNRIRRNGNTKPATKQPRKIFLAVAASSQGVDVIFLNSLASLTANPPVSIKISCHCDPSLNRARNLLARNFLLSDCTHLLFVSPDVGFTAADVDRISSHAAPIVGGLVPLRNQAARVEWCGEGKTIVGGIKSGLTEVSFVGLDFLCIRRSALEKISGYHTQLKYAENGCDRLDTAFFEECVQDNEFYTADRLFCRHWIQLGMKIFADSQVVLKRAGRAEWPLSLQAGNPLERMPLSA